MSFLTGVARGLSDPKIGKHLLREEGEVVVVQIGRREVDGAFFGRAGSRSNPAARPIKATSPLSIDLISIS